MNSEASVEHICLSSGEDENPRQRVTDAQLQQSYRPRRYQGRFTIFNQHYLAIETKEFGAPPRTYSVDLTFVDPHPLRQRMIAWPFAWASCALMAIALVTSFLGSTLPLSVRLLLTGLSLLGAAGCAAGLFLRSRDRIVMYSQHGRAPLITFLRKLPTDRALKGFVLDLGRRIEISRQEWPDQAQLLSAELREHRRLRDEGALSDELYEAAKQRLLSAHQ